ncbi:MAG: hypothetical protein R3B72_01365 [Polyangiaceae bacterium]
MSTTTETETTETTTPETPAPVPSYTADLDAEIAALEAQIAEVTEREQMEAIKLPFDVDDLPRLLTAEQYQAIASHLTPAEVAKFQAMLNTKNQREELRRKEAEREAKQQERARAIKEILDVARGRTEAEDLRDAKARHRDKVGRLTANVLGMKVVDKPDPNVLVVESPAEWMTEAERRDLGRRNARKVLHWQNGRQLLGQGPGPVRYDDGTPYRAGRAPSGGEAA